MKPIKASCKRPNIIEDASCNPETKHNHDIFYGIHTVQEVTTPSGPAYKVKGSTSPSNWSDPKYTQFIEFVCRLSIDGIHNSLWQSARSLTWRGGFEYFFKWNDKYYVLGRNKNDQAIKKTLETGYGHRTYNDFGMIGELLEMTLFEVDQALIPFIDYIHKGVKERRILDQASN